MSVILLCHLILTDFFSTFLKVIFLNDVGLIAMSLVHTGGLTEALSFVDFQLGINLDFISPIQLHIFFQMPHWIVLF